MITRPCIQNRWWKINMLGTRHLNHCTWSKWCELIVMWIDGIILTECIVIGLMYLKAVTEIYPSSSVPRFDDRRISTFAKLKVTDVGVTRFSPHGQLWGGLNCGTYRFTHPPGSFLYYSVDLSTPYSIQATPRFGFSGIIPCMGLTDGLGMIMSRR